MQKKFEEEMTIKEKKCSKQMLTPNLESTILASQLGLMHTHLDISAPPNKRSLPLPTPIPLSREDGVHAL